MTAIERNAALGKDIKIPEVDSFSAIGNKSGSTECSSHMDQRETKRNAAFYDLLNTATSMLGQLVFIMVALYSHAIDTYH